MNDNKRKSRLGFWIATSLAIFFFLCSIALFSSLMGLLIIKGALSPHEEEGKTKKLAETVIEGTGTDKILIIPVKGVITAQSSRKLFQETPSMVESVTQQLDQAR